MMQIQGIILTFGTYPQTEDGTDRTPIHWRVLRNTSSELFVLSEYIMDCKRYHGKNVNTTWHDCDLRKWLNRVFYTSAFIDVEKKVIRTSHCFDNGEGTPDTEDRVFLLSVNEIKTFTDVSDNNDTRRRTEGTEFAKIRKADGCR